jgi:hypothetical protein
MLRAPWQECWRRFSETPAQFVGLHNHLTAGEPAKFCLLEFPGEEQSPNLSTSA